jgi:hypothetical protein
VNIPGHGTDGVMGTEAWRRGFVSRSGEIAIRTSGRVVGVGECSFRSFVVVEDVGGDCSWTGEGFVFQTLCLADLGVSQAFAFAIEDQLDVVNERHAVGVGKLLSASADEVYVGTVFEDEASGLDGVAEALDTGYAARSQVATVHEQGVKLNVAAGG